MLLKRGGRHWIVIDSFLDPGSLTPIALEYLSTIRVDAATSVRLIANTHLHDDHSRGLARILRHCHNAAFACSEATTVSEVLALILAAAPRETAITKEFAEILSVLNERRAQRQRAIHIVRASESKILLDLPTPANGPPVTRRIEALSPSAVTITIAQQRLALSLRNDLGVRRIPAQSLNDVSVAMWITAGDVGVLLGADLEEKAYPGEGWSAVVANWRGRADRAQLFKVPHHGSETAHHDGVWPNMISGEATAVISTFTPSRLPTSRDLQRLCGLTPNVFVTSERGGRRVPRRPPEVERTIAEVARSRGTLQKKCGQVRFRTSLVGPVTPTVELFPDAYRACAGNAA